MSEVGRALREQLDQQEHVWGHIQQDRWASLMEYATGTVLDVGCANGVYVNRLREYGFLTYGVDLLTYPEWSALAGRVLLADAVNLPFGDAQFDTIISFETLEHIPTPLDALRTYHRVCKKRVILSVPNCETPADLREGGFTYHHWVDRTHVNFFTLDTFSNIVSQAGFKVIEARRINHILPAVPLLCSLGISPRWAQRIARRIRAVSLRQYPMTLLVVADKE